MNQGPGTAFEFIRIVVTRQDSTRLVVDGHLLAQCCPQPKLQFPVLLLLVAEQSFLKFRTLPELLRRKRHSSIDHLLHLPHLPLRPPFLGIRSMSSHAESAVRPEPDQVVQDIADYVHNFKIESPLAFETARLCLIDTIGCGLEGLRFEACARLLGPVVEGTVVPNGALFFFLPT